MMDTKSITDALSKGVSWLMEPSEDARKKLVEILEKSDLPDEEKIIYIRDSRRLVRQNENLRAVLNLVRDSKNGETLSLDQFENEWVDFFCERAKCASKDEIRIIWARLMGQKAQGYSVSKKLMHTLSLLEADDIKSFLVICSLTFRSLDREISNYPMIYIIDHPLYYQSRGLTRYKLASLTQLGLIEYNPNGEFVLPKKTPTIAYNSAKVVFDPGVRIQNGNVRFTGDGRELYSIVEPHNHKSFVEFCSTVWSSRAIRFTIENT